MAIPEPGARASGVCQDLFAKYPSLVSLPNTTTYGEERIGKQDQVP